MAEEEERGKHARHVLGTVPCPTHIILVHPPNDLRVSQELLLSPLHREEEQGLGSQLLPKLLFIYLFNQFMYLFFLSF